MDRHMTPHDMRDVFAVGPLRAMYCTLNQRQCAYHRLVARGRRLLGIAMLAVICYCYEQFTEFVWGQVATGYPFLWVLRSDMLRVLP